MANEATLRAERRSWTCALEDFAGVYGTGALIGPDLVLTNYHVVEKLRRDPTRQADARVHFDYFAPETGRRIPLAQVWDVAMSSYSFQDLNADMPADPEKLDYAVIRLAERVGELPLPADYAAGWPDGTRPARRGWLVLPKPEMRPAKDTPIDIYHHPCTIGNQGVSSLPLPDVPSRGTIISIDPGELRVTHNAETVHGSSGAICYGKNLEPVALHHAGDPGSALKNVKRPPGQRAIPLGAIAAQLFRKNRKIYDETLPQQAADVELAKGTETIAEDVLRRRHNRAMALFDRDDAEWNIIDSRRQKQSLVHAIACRRIDGQAFFMTRLREASLALEGLPRTEIDERLARLLNTGWSQNGWLDGPVTLDTSLPPTAAAEKIARQIEREIRSTQGTIFAIGQTFDKFDFERERLLVTEVGRRCVPLAKNAEFQVFFVYEDNRHSGDGRDPRARLRASVADFWTRPPAGCGQCLSLDDIESNKLGKWMSTIDRAYKINREELADDVGKLFRGGKMPFMALEPKLFRYVTSKYCRDTR
ncbi:serine protease [Mesorhizobium sp. M0016]|uniref:trypsin-like serine peptidase n=1 Tax=Mesorhizobium sp. M0016 TaxID=2956843 RepID=UPI003338AE79